MTNHIRDFQILYDDEIGSLDEPGRFLMKPAIAGIGDLTVQSCHLHTHFMAAMTASLAAGIARAAGGAVLSPLAVQCVDSEFPPCHCNRRIPRVPDPRR